MSALTPGPALWKGFLLTSEPFPLLLAVVLKSLPGSDRRPGCAASLLLLPACPSGFARGPSLLCLGIPCSVLDTAGKAVGRLPWQTLAQGPNPVRLLLYVQERTLVSGACKIVKRVVFHTA